MQEKAQTWRGRYHAGAMFVPQWVDLRNRFNITCGPAIATIAYDGRLIRNWAIVSVISLTSLRPAAPPLFDHQASRAFGVCT